MTIHGEHPFLPDEGARDPLRRLRGRLTGPVTLWTAGAGADRAGLTVSSLLVAEPGQVVGLVGADSDLLERVQADGRFTVQVLGWDDRDVADEVAGVRPAPGGVFRIREWRDTRWGPLLPSVTTWAGCRAVDVRDAGWGRLVTGEVEHAEAGEMPAPLLWHRGGYRTLAP